MHANGLQDSKRMLRHLDPQPGERILDYGCGTGATLILIHAHRDNCELFGLDRSLSMVNAARARIKYCNLHTEIRIFQEKEWNYADHAGFFDKIYVESVLTIQSTKDLKVILRNLKLMLKGGGKLILNETLWLENTDQEEIRQINEYALKNWGIVQSNAEIATLEDWKRVLIECGFSDPQELNISGTEISFNKNMLKNSEQFTSKQKLKHFTDPKLFVNYLKLKNSRPPISQKQLMKGFLITASAN